MTTGCKGVQVRRTTQASYTQSPGLRPRIHTTLAYAGRVFARQPGKGTAGDHKGPPNPARPPSPLRTDDETFQKATRESTTPATTRTEPIKGFIPV
jgi:hypothetical protein